MIGIVLLAVEQVNLGALPQTPEFGAWVPPAVGMRRDRGGANPPDPLPYGSRLALGSHSCGALSSGRQRHPRLQRGSRSSGPTCWWHQSAKLRGCGGRAPACFSAIVSDGRQHAGQHLEAQVLFVAQAEGTALEYADLGVEALDKTQSHLVFRTAVGRDPAPVPLDHGGE